MRAPHTMSTRQKWKHAKITVPTGETFNGWELWVDGKLFGRASDKDSLLNALTRQREMTKPENLHWRAIHYRRRFGGKEKETPHDGDI